MSNSCEFRTWALLIVFGALMLLMTFKVNDNRERLDKLEEVQKDTFRIIIPNIKRPKETTIERDRILEEQIHKST